MSQRRKRSRSPLDGRERKRYEIERHERYKEHASHAKHRDKQGQDYVSGQETLVGERYHTNEDRDRERHKGFEKRLHEDREGRKDGGNHISYKHEGESSQRRKRERTTDYRQERSRKESGGNRKLLFKARDQRPVRAEETEHTSRYGQPANTEASNTEDAVRTEEPNFGLSGKLTEYTNTYKGVVIKYNEPPEARKPKTRWRLYPFKGEETLPVLYIHRQSAFLLGRQRHIADIPIDHPSCSKQHAVLQYKLADYQKPDGTMGRKVKPYIIDLESANGTYLNNERIDARRYYELKEQDVLKFGFSSREYVILHERSLKKENQDISASEDSPE